VSVCSHGEMKFMLVEMLLLEVDKGTSAYHYGATYCNAVTIRESLLLNLTRLHFAT
jgi:hypothetical protein